MQRPDAFDVPAERRRPTEAFAAEPGREADGGRQLASLAACCRSLRGALGGAVDMYSVTCGDFTVSVQNGGLPDLYTEYVTRAEFVFEKHVRESEGMAAFCSVARGSDWPFCVLSIRYAPAGSGFSPGVLLIPETEVLFLGAGALLLAIDLKNRRKLWEEEAEVGFWSWRRHQDIVLMSAELALGAWSIKGEKRWSKFVEPPWSYAIRDGKVILDVMGNVSQFPVEAGPPAA